MGSAMVSRGSVAKWPELFWSTLVVGFFVAPLIILLLHIGDLSLSAFNIKLLKTFLLALQQSVYSVLGICVVGIIGALGLCGITDRKWRRGAEVLFLVPTLVPSFYIILSTFRWAEILNWNVMGLSGVVFAHVATYAGLFAVFFARSLEMKLSQISALCAVEGAGSIRFFKSAWPMVRPDFLVLVLTIFFACWASFSIPLIFGGGRIYSMEILIYESSIVMGQWDHAWVYSVLQASALLLISFFIGSQALPTGQGDRLYLLGRPWLCGLLVGFILVTLFLGFKGLLFSKTSFIFLLKLIGLELFTAAVGTVVMILSSIVLAEILMFVIGYFFPANFIRRFLMGWIGTSVALTGAATLLTVQGANYSSYGLVPVMAVGIMIFTFPALYKLTSEPLLNSMHQQVEQSKVLGASRWLTYIYVIAPQLRQGAELRVLLLSLWVGGEFAFSSMVAGRPLTLGILGYQYLNGYYLEAAEIVLLFVLLVPLTVTALYSTFIRTENWFVKQAKRTRYVSH